ncbi:MAG: lamin tail domain-containing protein [Planctomycetes bacterium]|nr:lamin tail domain-containing protein [Planctomycetota bacterium]
MININTASPVEFDTLPGIGPAKAQAIIYYRAQNGSFRTIEEIMNVSGIGPTTFDGLKDSITVDEENEPPPINAAVCGNGAVETGEECDDGNAVSGDGCGAGCQTEEAPDSQTSPQAAPARGEEGGARPGEVVINEFVSDPADGEVEWIELYNKLSRDVDLAEWTIEEGSGAKTTLAGVLAGSGAGKFLAFEKPKGSLNNAGDIIILRDAGGELIDQVAYGNWDDGNKDNNAPAAGDPNSVARKADGYNTNNNANDFKLTTVFTKGSSNIMAGAEEEEEISASERPGYDYSDDIIISEIMPDPAGSDEEGEFIELYNRGFKEVDLTGWKLGDESTKNFEFRILNLEFRNKNIIKAGGYKVFYRSETKLALNNSGDSVKLYPPLADAPVAVVKYEKAVEGWSYNAELTLLRQGYGGQGIKNLELRMLDKFVWSESVTPGKENIIKDFNHAPVVDFDCPEEAFLAKPVLFDGADTIDEDGDKLAFVWNFGDGATNTLPIPEHTFFKTGSFTVKLAVSDGKITVNKDKKIKIVKALSARENYEVATAESPAAEAEPNVIINEFLPDPAGADEEGEWIELYNRGGTVVNMLDWRLDDEEGGSKPYRFSAGWLFAPGKFRLIERSESKLALNNPGGAVRLFNADGDLIDEAIYGAASEGEVYARGENGKWFWSTATTPGERNLIAVADSVAVRAMAATGRALVQPSAAAEPSVVEITLEKIQEMEVGDAVKVSGTVAVLPGILGSQYFYIVGSPGVQIYSYKKDFPTLAVGDYITVTGELSQTYGEWRVKTKTAADMEVVGPGEPPAPTEIACDKISEEAAGQLVAIAGEITDRKSSTVYFDDGTGEIIIYIKAATGIALSNLKEGRRASITGLVGRTSSGVRVMPRSGEDIVYEEEAAEGETRQVLGEVAASDEWEIGVRDKKFELFKYLLIVAGAVILVLGGLLFRMRRR